jgi:AcrR family transcriptional regulator
METRAQPASKRNGDDTRQRLLAAAVDIFGRKGFEASTRELASEAGVNLAAIPYYFGGKEGLYLAVAEYIAEQILAHVGATAARIRSRLPLGPQPAATPAGPDEARSLLAELLDTFAGVLVSDESAPWARFIIREQMEPTEAFDRLYNAVMSRVIETIRVLLGIITGADPESETVRLRAIALVGQILIFRAARAAVMRQLAWDEIGESQREAIRAMIRDSVASLPPAPRGSSP